MYRQDWLMRQIETMAQAIARIIFNKNEPNYEIINESNHTETDLLFHSLLALLEGEKINEAENLLFENINNDDVNYLLLAIDFYSRLNSLDDETLEKNNFSREEIESGMEEIKKQFGIAL